MPDISIVIVNRSSFAREIIARSLDSHDGISVLSHHPDLASAVAGASLQTTDVLVVDFADTRHAELIWSVRNLAPELRVVVSGLTLTDRDILACAAAGTSGYIRCEAVEDEWTAAIIAASSNQIADAHIAGRLNALLCEQLQSSRRGLSNVNPFQVSRRVASSARRAGLTPRERQIMNLVNQGFSTKRIARELSVTPNTVKTHISAILSKYQVHRRSEAAALYRAEGRRDSDAISKT